MTTDEDEDEPYNTRNTMHVYVMSLCLNLNYKTTQNFRPDTRMRQQRIFFGKVWGRPRVRYKHKNTRASTFNCSSKFLSIFREWFFELFWRLEKISSRWNFLLFMVYSMRMDRYCYCYGEQQLQGMEYVISGSFGSSQIIILQFYLAFSKSIVEFIEILV